MKTRKNFSEDIPVVKIIFQNMADVYAGKFDQYILIESILMNTWGEKQKRAAR